MKYFLLLILLLSFTLDSTAQCAIEVQDILLCRDNKEVHVVPTLTPSPISHSYELIEEPFAPEALINFNIISLLDDDVAGPFALGFEFEFFGQSYTEFYIGSNGWVSFSPDQPITYVPEEIPNVSPDLPKNCIMGPWEDWDPSQGGEVKYSLIGSPPTRKMVIEFYNVAHFVCGNDISSSGYFQIVLEEENNDVLGHIIRKPICAGENATFGLHNSEGSRSYTFSGRNASEWESMNQTVRFNTNNYTNLFWSVEENADPSFNTLIFTPQTSSTYTVTAYDAIGNTCYDDFEILISPLLDPFLEVVDNNVLHCNLAGYQYQWYLNGEAIEGEVYQDLILFAFGSYTVELTDENGCKFMSRVHLYTKPNSIEELMEILTIAVKNNQLDICFPFTHSTLKFKLHDLNGKIIYESEENNSFIINNITNKGIYLLSIVDESGMLTRKIIIL